MKLSELIQSGYEPHNDWEEAQLGALLLESVIHFVEHCGESYAALKNLRWSLIRDMERAKRTGSLV